MSNNLEDSFHVSQGAFTGPYSVLLDLIRKNELDISEISLYTIVDEFISYVKQLAEDNQMEEMSEFLQTSALLLKIKLSVLLPKPESLMTEEDFAVLEAKDILFAKLLQYNAFQTVAKIFAQQINGEQEIYPRQTDFSDMPFPPIHWNIDAGKLASIFSQILLAKQPEVLDISHLHDPKLSVTKQRKKLLHKLVKAKELSFHKLVLAENNNLAIAVMFLTLLIMYKDKEIDLSQSKHLSDIKIVKHLKSKIK
ncbi:MAG: segregation/condensation protein A [Bifidobacteriaceae bacterium]|nr:segregation/condensation protein A [Bifidobacteriaceae bacterium]